jgi:hypothetical protein
MGRTRRPDPLLQKPPAATWTHRSATTPPFLPNPAHPCRFPLRPSDATAPPCPLAAWHAPCLSAQLLRRADHSRTCPLTCACAAAATPYHRFSRSAAWLSSAPTGSAAMDGLISMATGHCLIRRTAWVLEAEALASMSALHSWTAPPSSTVRRHLIISIVHERWLPRRKGIWCLVL